MAETRIEDFGKKIGGAKKDQWRSRGLSYADTLGMTDAEKEKYVKRDEIWPKPDWEKLIAEGLDPGVAYFINNVRLGLESKPYSLDITTGYIKTVSYIRDKAMGITTGGQVDGFFKDVSPEIIIPVTKYSCAIKDECRGAVRNKALRAMQKSYWKCCAESKRKLFGIPKGCRAYAEAKNNFSIFLYDGVAVKNGEDCHKKQMVLAKVGGWTYYYYPRERVEFEVGTYIVAYKPRRDVILWNATKEEAEIFVESAALSAQKEADGKGAVASKRKPKFVRQTDGGEMVLPDAAEEIDGVDYLKTFGFYGGEFGNWVNQKERKGSLVYGYYAFLDLADVLGIDAKAVSFYGQLSIAFGARGHGKAAAHYEPLRQVINLTKPRGAGCLAHEWGHALDDYIGRENGAGTGRLGSGTPRKMPEVFRVLLESLRVQDGGFTEFYLGSKKFDKALARDGGYWQSPEEMFARSFDCYVSDKLKERGRRNDYLTSGADSFHADMDGKEVYAIPVGKEREVINKNFDNLFAYLKGASLLLDAA